MTGEPFFRAPSLDPYRETKTGGRWSPLRVAVGDVIGKSVVLRDLGVDPRLACGSRRFEVTCEHCECVQIRTSAQLNASLRKKRPVTCPRCLSEGRAARALEIFDWRTERVLGGGPVYSDWEMQTICDDVRNELVEEWGYPPEPIEELNIDPGWPYSAHRPGEKTVEEAIRDAKQEREWIAKENKYRFEKRDREYAMALKQHYLREARQFREKSEEVAELLERVIALGGTIDAPSDPCPCKSGLEFQNCHGLEIKVVAPEATTAEAKPNRGRRSQQFILLDGPCPCKSGLRYRECHYFARQIVKAAVEKADALFGSNDEGQDEEGK